MSTTTTAVGGERVASAEGGYNPSFQRHRSHYKFAAARLGPGRVIDLGCGTGHSWEELAPRATVGVDIDPGALAEQERETCAADIRSLPFPDASFESLVSIHSLEHVPDPERVVCEAARVLTPTGRAIFATPNRLTFGRPDEIINPYHYVEFDAEQLREVCLRGFAAVEILAPQRVAALPGDPRRRAPRARSHAPP